MYSNQRSNEILLDFRGLFWSFFSQWKAFLIFALIVSMLLTGLNYKKSMDAYDAAVAEANERSLSAAEAQARIDESMGMLSSVERANVEYAVSIYDFIQEKQAYQRFSPLMQVDPNRTNILTLTYRVNGDLDQSVLSSLGDGYLTAFNDADTIASVAKSSGTAYAPEYIKELISFSDPSDDSVSASSGFLNDEKVFSVFVVIPPDEDAGAFEKAVTDAIKAKSSVLSKSIAPHDVVLISSESFVSSCSSILSKQTEVYYSISYLKSAYGNAYNDLNDYQIAAFNTLLRLKSVAEGKVDPEPLILPDKPGINKRTLVTGFGFGIILYFAIFVLYTMFVGKVISSKIAKKLLHCRFIGEYYEMAKDGTLLDKMFHSRTVFNHRYRGRIDTDKQTSEIVQNIKTLALKDGLNKISLIPADSSQACFSSAVKSGCEKAGLNASFWGVDSGAESFDLLESSCNVITVSNHTEAGQLNQLVDALNRNGVNVVGFIYTADR